MLRGAYDTKLLGGLSVGHTDCTPRIRERGSGGVDGRRRENTTTDNLGDNLVIAGGTCNVVDNVE